MGYKFEFNDFLDLFVLGLAMRGLYVIRGFGLPELVGVVGGVSLNEDLMLGLIMVGIGIFISGFWFGNRLRVSVNESD